MTIELFVRPFQRGEITPPAVISNGTKLADLVEARFDHKGDAAIFDFSNSSSFDYEQIGGKHKEVKRQSQTVRVENPDDSTQFVEIKRAKKITFMNQQNKEKNTYTFVYKKNPGEQEGV